MSHSAAFLSTAPTGHDSSTSGTGVLTMAFGHEAYVRMAKGLARSVRLRSPDTKLAIVSDRPLGSLSRWFDEELPLDRSFGPGLAQKLHLDLYSPFDHTLFIDSDFLVFHDIEVIWERFRGTRGLGLVGRHMSQGEAHYAIEDLPAFMGELGLRRMVMTNTGVLCFDGSADATTAFETARGLSRRADDLGLRSHPAGSFNDEPIFGAVVEMLGLPFVTSEPDDPSPLFTLGAFGTEGMHEIDVLDGNSRHLFAGQVVEPAAIHFNVSSQESKVYDRELRRLELGPSLGRTPMPEIVTAITWGARSIGSTPRRAARRLRRMAVFADGYPYSAVNRRERPTAPHRLVEEVARRSSTPFTFIQVGSNDGQTGDPLFGTVMGTDVRGLLVEPVPELFARLEATYRSKTGLTLVQAAVAEVDEPRDFHWVPSRAGDPVWVDQLGSFSRDVILSHEEELPDVAERIQTISVPCRTLASLVEEHGLQRVDLLHIDAEGADLAILRTIDFDAAWAPRCILYEQKHLGTSAVEATDLLHAAGYRFVDFGTDVFAHRGLRGRILARGRRRTGSATG